MWHDSSKDIQYMYGYISSGCMCVLILEHAFYITGACVMSHVIEVVLFRGISVTHSLS